jgi:hypothetical protein
MTTKLTPWMSVGTPPLNSRPGMYKCRQGLNIPATRYGRVFMAEWRNGRWQSGGMLEAEWGDQWRGIAKG